MKLLLKIISFVGGSILLVLLHVILVDFFPYPLNYINVVFIGLLWWLIYNPSYETKIRIVLVGWLIELYASTPFGILLISLVAALLIVDWLLRTILTHHSWYMVFLTGVAGLALYRVIYVLLLIVGASFFHVGAIPNVKILTVVIQEVLLSSFGIVLLYFVSQLFTRRMNPRYINLT